jgi:hypothetical protein
MDNATIEWDFVLSFFGSHLVRPRKPAVDTPDVVAEKSWDALSRAAESDDDSGSASVLTTSETLGATGESDGKRKASVIESIWKQVMGPCFEYAKVCESSPLTYPMFLWRLSEVGHGRTSHNPCSTRLYHRLSLFCR